MILLALIAAIGAHGPKTTTMLGTDAALECPLVSGVVCETAAGPDVAVSTTRASTRMCWTGSAWQTVPANTPCIGRYGLASFEAGTNYWANSADPSKWGTANGATISGDTVTTAATTGAAFRADPVSVASGEAWTLTCEMKAGTVTSVQLNPTANNLCARTTLTPDWSRVSCTVTSSVTASVQPYVGLSNVVGTFHVRQCQLEKSPTPGPRHDCEAAPCSWAADVHTVSTAGWPVASGEVRLQYTPLNTSPVSIHLLDARSGTGAGFRLYFNASGAIVFNTSDGATQGACGRSGLTWLGGQTYSLRAVWGAGSITVYRDDESICTASSQQMPTAIAATGYLGSNNTGIQQSSGHIRLVRISE